MLEYSIMYICMGKTIEYSLAHSPTYSLPHRWIIQLSSDKIPADVISDKIPLIISLFAKNQTIRLLLTTP